MNPRDVFLEARRALVAHRFRATLSSIGIVVGIATVVTALAIGDGARRAAVDEISQLGVDNILIRSKTSALTTRDEAALRAAIPGLRATASLRTTHVELTAAGPVIAATVVGVTVDWAAIADAVVDRGRWLVDRDMTTQRRVAIVGSELARALDPRGDPLGRQLIIHGDAYAVVGVLARRQASSVNVKRNPLQAFDLDRSVIVPLPALDVRRAKDDEPGGVDEIALRAGSAADVLDAAARADGQVRRRHHGDRRFEDRSAYEIVVPRALLAARVRAQRTFTCVWLGIGALALIISGVGIMNIMLATVAERTHEIGVRRAFGARRRDVLAQFATEAGLLCLAGGALGLPTGAALSTLVAVAAGWPISFSLGSMIVALLLAVAVGLTFGIYPATRAAAITPIEALRAP